MDYFSPGFEREKLTLLCKWEGKDVATAGKMVATYRIAIPNGPGIPFLALGLSKSWIETVAVRAIFVAV